MSLDHEFLPLLPKVLQLCLPKSPARIRRSRSDGHKIKIPSPSLPGLTGRQRNGTSGSRRESREQAHNSPAAAAGRSYNQRHTAHPNVGKSLSSSHVSNLATNLKWLCCPKPWERT